ncbi:MAG: hypothetical protein EBS06_04395 [Proteobacteria bacterium]|nr:hypothetical protein [Pseudomonadota bacterium]
MKKPSNQKTRIEKQIVSQIELLKIPFAGTTIQSDSKKYHISPFQQISISGIGPIFYLNQKDQKIYTLLQRRFKDNFQWWFPGGYVELPSANHGFFLENFEKIKNATIDEFYKNSFDYGCWQKAKKEINDPKSLTKFFKKHKIKWPKEIDANWQSAWQREVFEETGVDLEKFSKRVILDFKFNHTLMIGAERDRLTNIDGKFCAFLGELKTHPKTIPDSEIEELQWIALDEISFDKKKKNFFAHQKIVNLYTVTLIEESLFEIICHEIKKVSKIKNPLTKQKISRFNTPQNLQSFLISNFCSGWKKQNYPLISKFLAWQFGDLEIGKNLCSKNGDMLYKISLKISEFLTLKNISSELDFKSLENFIKTK